MNFFLDPQFDPDRGVLNPEESRHAFKVLRLRPGAPLLIGDGKGSLYTGELVGARPDEARVNVFEEEVFAEPEAKVTVAIAPTKNLTRFEWFLEKATELGVWKVIPLMTKRTLRERIKDSRAQKILLQASKQSGRYFIPRIEPVTEFEAVLKMDSDDRLIAHCHAEMERHPLSLHRGGGNSLILIGPEGDFTREEVEAAEASGCKPIILGENRLRTETAGILTVALLQLSEV